MTRRKPGARIEEEFLAYKDSLRANLLEFTRRAFKMLTMIEKPAILDVGCGSGVATLELARLSGGRIIGIDTNPACLTRLRSEIRRAGLSGRVEAKERSMFGLDFPDGSFDIIWAEGAIAVIGFARGLKEWSRLLKSGGYLVVHDDLKGLGDKLEIVPRRGYELIGHFTMDENIWWAEYYGPLRRKLDEMRSGYPGDPWVAEILKDDQRQIDGFKKNKARYRSVFFVLRKN